VLPFHSLLNVEDADLPLPQVQRVANIQELLLPVKLELVQCLRPRGAVKTVELLTMDADDVPRSPSQLRMVRKMSWNSGSLKWAETDTNRITIGFTSRNTARKIRRLKGLDSTIP
jgi:hypothetical protein